jgi:tetratricopeptide (TPR) repeat protein/tRNA A-37 threonylcarbamoyl transferase component Bud32
MEQRPPPHTLGRYRIEERIGAGGMGVVYRAYDAQLDRYVAIKVLPSEDFKDPTLRARLVQEARTASRLNHPNICTVHEAGEADGQAYIAMELVEGEVLSVRLESGPLPPEKIVRYGAQLADALTHAHERGVVHRDLKTSNAIITLDDRIKVLDFGLAKRVRVDEPEGATSRADPTLTRPGTAVGTLAYMAPEQLRGLPADARTDIWALGVVIYEMATSRKPFTGGTAYEISAAILEGEPAPLPDRVPAEIAGVIVRCLQRDPSRRFQQSGEVRASLETATSTPGAGLARRWSLPSRPIRIAAGAMGLLLAIAVIGALDVGSLRRRVAALFSADAIAFSERDWLLAAQFENQTGDELFDKSLDTALAVGMGQSGYVNLVPASRIGGALRRMKLPAGTGLDGATARLIAQREGIKLVMVPRIAEVGGLYQLSGSLEDPETGAVLRSAVVGSLESHEVLGGIDELVGRIRNDLGEARRSIEGHGKPLAQVTTSSLPALKVFSVARETLLAGRIDEALALYEEALRLDPSFTGARAQIGMIHFELRDREKGKMLLAQVIQDVDDLTDKERYSVLAFHAAAVENNPQKAIDLYQALLALYPDASPVHNNIGRAYMQMGRWEEAVASLKRALSIDPDIMLTYNSLNQIYLYQLGELEAAVALCLQQQTYNDQSYFAFDNLGWAMLGKGDLAQAREAFQKALAISPRSTAALFRLGHTYRLEGRYQEARDAFLKIPEIDPEERTAYYDAAIAAQRMGDEQAARGDFLRYQELVERRLREDSKDAHAHMELAAVLARLGEGARADSAAARGMTLDPSLQFEYASVLSLRGRSEEAIRHLEQAIEGGFRDFVGMKIEVDLEPVSAEPKFQEFLERYLKL